MITGKSVLAVIPARGGSKGVHRKNIKIAGGKPLIVWTIEEAVKSRYIDRLILSSEDEEIIKIAESLGCEVPFVRPAELARDDTPGLEVILHAVSKLPRYDYVVILQPTSPLRLAEDIDGCIEMCVQKNVESCVTVTLTDKHPYWMYRIDEKGYMQPLLKTEKIIRRQDLPPVYILNGAVYVRKYDSLTRGTEYDPAKTAYCMPPERSLDIDTEQDFMLMETIIHSRQLKENI